MSRSVRSVVVVGAHPQRAQLDAMLVDTNEYDVVYVESIRKGYSRIRRVTPDVVMSFRGSTMLLPAGCCRC